MALRWDAARAASERRERKYKPVGPVGDPTRNDVTGLPRGAYEVLSRGEKVKVWSSGTDQPLRRCEPEVCRTCHVHVCVCTPWSEPWRHEPQLAPDNGTGVRLRAANISGLTSDAELFKVIARTAMLLGNFGDKENVRFQAHANPVDAKRVSKHVREELLLIGIRLHVNPYVKLDRVCVSRVDSTWLPAVDST